MNAASQPSSGPIHTTIRRVDQLIPVDDISQLCSVQAMLEDARITATTVGSTPYSAPQSSPLDSNLQTQSTPVANNPLDTDSDLQTPTPAPTPPTSVASGPPDSDLDSGESDTDSSFSDPDWKQKNKSKPGNGCKRSTRANRDPAMAHCSL